MYRNKSTLLSAEMKTVGAEWLFFDLLGVRVVGKKKGEEQVTYILTSADRWDLLLL